MNGSPLLIGARGTTRGRTWGASHCAMAALVAAGAVASIPAAAQAAPLGPATTGAALCSGVSASQVSSVVGWKVPAATVESNSDYFDKSLAIHENSTICTYGAPTSEASLGQLVVFTYDTLSKVPSRSAALAEIKSSFQKSASKLPKGSKFTYSISNTFGVTSLYAMVSASEAGFSFTVVFAYGWKGNRVAGAAIQHNVPEATAQSLEKLALNNFGL